MGSGIACTLKHTAEHASYLHRDNVVCHIYSSYLLCTDTTYPASEVQSDLEYFIEEAYITCLEEFLGSTDLFDVQDMQWQYRQQVLDTPSVK